MDGGEALPWAIGTLDLAGAIRSRYVRLQDWVRVVLLGEPAAVAKAP